VPKTYAEQLDDVQAAIEAIELGEQSFVLNGRGVTRANLDDLYEREERLRRKVGKLARGGILARQVARGG